MFEQTKQLSHEVEHDARRLAETLSRFLGASTQEGKGALSQASGKTHEMWHQASATAREKGRVLDHYARENVWTTVAVAAVAGLVAGLMSRRCKRCD